MAKINNILIYGLEDLPDLLDFLIGSKKKNGKTMNFSLQSIINLINGVNGKNVIQYKFFNETTPDIDYTTPGAFFTNNNQTDVNNFSSLLFNKKTLGNYDLTVLFDFLSGVGDLFIGIDNPSNPNNFFTLKVTSISNQGDYFIFNVEPYNGLYIGELSHESIYSLYWETKEWISQIDDINSDLDSKLDHGGYTGTGQDLKNEIDAVTTDLADNYYTKPEVDGKISSVYRFRGNVANFAALPTIGLTIGDVYNALDTDINWAWTGTVWDNLGGTSDISGKEDKSNKQNSLVPDGTGQKYLTVDAAITGLNLKLDKGTYTGNAGDLKAAIDAIFVPDQLISAVPPTRSVNTFTYPALGYTALISKTLRTNPAQFITTITAASTTNHKRVDLIYFKPDNTLAKLIGTEDLVVAPRPDVPDGSVGVSFINVFGNVIETPTPITDEISIQDYNGIQKFTITDYIRFKGFSFDATSKALITDPLTGGTIFVSNAIGDDANAYLENRSKPFKTIDAALLAMPNDGKIWTIWIIEGIQTTTNTLPDRSIIFYSPDDVTLIINSSWLSNNNIFKYTFDLKYGNLNFKTNLANKQGVSVVINCNIFNQIAGCDTCFLRIYGMDLTANEVNLIGIFLDQNTAYGIPYLNFNIGTLKGVGVCKLGVGGIDASVILNVKVNKLVATGSMLICGLSGKLVAEVGDYTVGYGNIFTAQPTDNYFITFINATGVNGTLLGASNAYSITISGNLHYTGYYLFDNYSNFKLYNLNLILNNAHLGWYFQGCGFEMYSSFITTSLTMSGGESLGAAYTRPLCRVFGECSIVKTDGLPFFNPYPSTTNAYIELIGTLKTNTSYYGNGVASITTALSFKEKTNEVVIRSKNDLINRVLSSSINYVIDGMIYLDSGESVIVPLGGLTISGYGFTPSAIFKNTSTESIFTSPVGGSGDLVTINISYYPGAGSVFNIKDSNGTHALEFDKVNFQGVAGSSLGKWDGYRQFTGTTCGFYGLSDGLILEGTWSGFKLTNSNIIGFGASGTFFKKGVALSFTNRFYIDLNLQISSGSIICDFLETNFVNPESLQVVNCYNKVAGVIDDTTTGVTFPNITPYSPKSYFSGNKGIKNSNIIPYGINAGKLLSYADDTAAAAGGIVAVGDTYIESSTGYFKKRLT